jgi:hypothetical protein
MIKALIPYLRTNSTQKFKLLGKVPKYNLYNFLTIRILFIKKFTISYNLYLLPLTKLTFMKCFTGSFSSLL